MSEPTPESSVNDSPPAQVTVSTGFAERVGPEGVRRWAQLIQEVADSARGADTQELADLLQTRLDAEGLGGPPVEMKRLGEAIASHAGGGIAFTYDSGEHIGGPHPQPTGPAHQETESEDRPTYS